ncbi:M12 family metallo-peptidase [Hymenobacter sp. ASUV-10]|uniref:M12 family metallo-peptidase n=1 Tax=Hymenobacter aranciens TaxID=3063996 RepID=A0ABT9B4N6_9BACT|nr:zinc-dependent metalloprotease family protein [Hymenobacter sp. ASUV-10]MDO7873224.1 M12 family metallo-peptidase [Hymenobacter sp. ASUV-10]
MPHSYASAARRLLGGMAFSLLGLGHVIAQQPQAAPALLRDEATGDSPLAAALTHARPLVLDLNAARATLATAPAEGQASADPLVLSLPLPDGRNARFALRATAVMAPALAAKFPEIKTYAGYGLDDATATVRLDVTPAGFHAQILSPTTGTIYIDPARRGDTRHYLSFSKRDMRRTGGPEVICAFRPDKADLAKMARQRQTQLGHGGGPLAISSGSLLRTYRLAVAATGEYAAFHGGTVALTQAAIVTSVNRVVGVYEKELAVRLVLVSNNDQLIYLNGNTDPYTNNDGGDMLGENQTNVDAIIGPANYDIGHVFSTGGGGVAGYAVVCGPDKASGVTGSSSPVGDSFDIDYVAHEMGHQFSGSHPFNGDDGACAGNRSGDRAWEPGSGTSIMAYAGICGATNDIAPHSDAQFHVGNYEEMRAFIVTTTCAVTTPTANTPPLVSAPASGLVLPINTPFKLTATGVDAEGDSLTYSWEELDLGTQGSPTATQVAGDNVPLFRSFVPQRSATRYFPQLPDVVNNTRTLGERLPMVTRQLTFKCTARDEHRGPAGSIGGVMSSDSVKLRVTSAAGPFVVTSPNTALNWPGGSTQTVTWAVAGTTANGVNCARVNIRLSTDGGYNYPTALALSVPNSGTATVTLPSVNTTTARLLVEAADNYFFDISDQNFTISSPSVCTPPVMLLTSNITNTGATVNFVPAAGATRYVLNTTPATTTQTVTASPIALTGLQPGTSYALSLVADCGGGSTSVAATGSFTTTAPPLCSGPSELAVSNLTQTSATLNFVGSASASSYVVTTVPASTTQTVTAGPVNLTGLQPGTTYVVRVTGNCAAGATSAAATLSFRTVAPPPVNDLCANALPLTCGVRVNGTTESVTDTGDPATFCSTSVDGGGVFYTIVGNGGVLTISTCGATDYDSKLLVYQGSCGGPYTCVDGNDDDPSCGVSSTVSFPSTNGVTYLVFVSGYNGSTGNFELLATCAAPSATAAAARPAFQVWPNPVGDGTAFRVTLPVPVAAATATLGNVLGQQLRQLLFAGSSAELSTAGLAAGTYLLTVQVAGQAPAVRRVVVK